MYGVEEKKESSLRFVGVVDCMLGGLLGGRRYNVKSWQEGATLGSCLEYQA
jgi:hypothetical protein